MRLLEVRTSRAVFRSFPTGQLPLRVSRVSGGGMLYLSTRYLAIAVATFSLPLSSIRLPSIPSSVLRLTH